MVWKPLQCVGTVPQELQMSTTVHQFEATSASGALDTSKEKLCQTNSSTAFKDSFSNKK